MIEMIEPSMLIILGLVALAAGFIDAVAGGGGMLTVPALLSIGLPPHIALGTNKLAATFASSTAAWTYYRKQLFSPAFWRMSFVATLIGAISGTLVVDLISTAWLEKVLPLIILTVAVYTIWHPHPKGSSHRLPTPCKKLSRKQWIQGTSLILRWCCGTGNRCILDSLQYGAIPVRYPEGIGTSQSNELHQ